MVGVKHLFKGGKFTQMLNLLALPTETSIPGFARPTVQQGSTASPTVAQAAAASPPPTPPATTSAQTTKQQRTPRGQPSRYPPNVIRSSFPGLSGQEAVNMRAFLHCIRVGEGTPDMDGYYRFVGGASFKHLGDADHPSILDSTNFGLNKLGGAVPRGTSAAGAYQILSTTWCDLRGQTLTIATGKFTNEKYKKHRDQLPDFKPETQDLAAFFLINQWKANKYVITGDLLSAFRVLHPCWTSLPGGLS